MYYYNCLTRQEYNYGEFSLKPIRFEDRYDIMQWRNEQIYHLRQNELLSKEQQDHYFENVVTKLFKQEKPTQILFSFLKGDKCIGYGGLVHINWIATQAEISFIMKTDMEGKYFEKCWLVFLQLIEKVGFEVLHFHKLCTYAYDLRPKLYPVLEKAGYKLKEKMLNVVEHNGSLIDVLIHEKHRQSSYE